MTTLLRSLVLSSCIKPAHNFTQQQAALAEMELLNYLADRRVAILALIEAARVVAKIADRETIEFATLHAALKPFEE